MSTLISRLQKVSDRLSALPQKLGVPQYSKVVLEASDGSYTVLVPQPMVFTVDSRKVGLELPGNVAIEPDDILLKEVSRSYNLEQITTSTVIIDAILDSQGKYQGKRGSVINVSQKNLLTYDVLVRQYRDR